MHNCSKQADAAAKINYSVPQFSWTKVHGENNNELLTSIIEISKLDNLDISNPHISCIALIPILPADILPHRSRM